MGAIGTTEILQWVPGTYPSELGAFKIDLIFVSKIESVTIKTYPGTRLLKIPSEEPGS